MITGPRLLPGSIAWAAAKSAEFIAGGTKAMGRRAGVRTACLLGARGLFIDRGLSRRLGGMIVFVADDSPIKTFAGPLFMRSVLMLMGHDASLCSAALIIYTARGPS
jgi:hypothetical protein